MKPGIRLVIEIELSGRGLRIAPTAIGAPPPNLRLRPLKNRAAATAAYGWVTPTWLIRRSVKPPATATWVSATHANTTAASSFCASCHFLTSTF